MLPDFSRPAFEFFALGLLSFHSWEDGSPRRVHSDYRCQLRWVRSAQADGDVEVRIFLVGREDAVSGEEVPVVLAFLCPEVDRGHCRVGTEFELREGGAVTAAGVVHALAGRYPVFGPWGACS